MSQISNSINDGSINSRQVFSVIDTRSPLSRGTSNNTPLRSVTITPVSQHRTDLPGTFAAQVASAKYEASIKLHMRNMEAFKSTEATGEIHKKVLSSLLGEALRRVRDEQKELLFNSSNDDYPSPSLISSGAPLRLLRDRRNSGEKLKRIAHLLRMKNKIQQCAMLVEKQYSRVSAAIQEKADTSDPTCSSLSEKGDLSCGSLSIEARDPYPELVKHIASQLLFQI